MDYMTFKEASEQWGISTWMISNYCSEGRVPEATKIGSFLVAPKSGKKLADKQRKPLKWEGSDD